MHRIVTAVAALLALASVVHGQYDLHAWPDRSAIVHLFEWKWEDVARECEDYLAPNHFAGIQVCTIFLNLGVLLILARYIIFLTCN